MTSHASRAAEVTEQHAQLHAVPDDDADRTEPSPAALADRAASKRRGEKPVTDPQAATPGADAKPEPKPKPKPAPKAKGPSETERRNLVLSALVHAAADLAGSWDPAATGISKADAREFLRARMSYCGPAVKWDARLGQRTTFKK